MFAGLPRQAAHARDPAAGREQLAEIPADLDLLLFQFRKRYPGAGALTGREIAFLNQSFRGLADRDGADPEFQRQVLGRRDPFDPLIDPPWIRLLTVAAILRYRGTRRCRMALSIPPVG